MCDCVKKMVGEDSVSRTKRLGKTPCRGRAVGGDPIVVSLGMVVRWAGPRVPRESLRRRRVGPPTTRYRIRRAASSRPSDEMSYTPCCFFQALRRDIVLLPDTSEGYFPHLYSRLPPASTSALRQALLPRIHRLSSRHSSTPAYTRIPASSRSFSSGWPPPRSFVSGRDPRRSPPAHFPHSLISWTRTATATNRWAPRPPPPNICGKRCRTVPGSRSPARSRYQTRGRCRIWRAFCGRLILVCGLWTRRRTMSGVGEEDMR